MINMYKYLLRPLLFRLTADYTHEATIKMASSVSKNKWVLKSTDALYNYKDPGLSQNLWGLTFPNPIGLAAGFDKNATAAPIMSRLGFGFIEVGSLTANPSTGNPKPRSFRLPKDRSLINRLGLNNDGSQTISRRLNNLDLNIPLGVNIAKTHDPSIVGERALNDYLISFNLVKDVADYITLNISCPNTEEGKTFEEPESLEALLTKLKIEKDSSLPPVLVKFSVDLEPLQLTELISVCEKFAVSGYVATNTSSKRDSLITSKHVLSNIGKGGLSGKAITHKSTSVIEQIYAQTKGEKPIIGVGGIDSSRDAIDKLKAGADLLQLYTGLVYEGPSLVKKINRELSAYLRENGIEKVYHIHKIKDQ